MFEVAVVGPIVTSGLGVARQCYECYRWDPTCKGMPCFGFGPGCIEFRPRSRASGEPALGDAGVPPPRK